jgi:protein TonB
VVVDAPPVIEAAPRLAAPAAVMADAHVVADNVPQPVPQPVAKPQAPAQKPTIAPAKPAVESSVAASVAGGWGQDAKGQQKRRGQGQHCGSQTGHAAVGLNYPQTDRGAQGLSCGGKRRPRHGDGDGDGAVDGQPGRAIAGRGCVAVVGRSRTDKAAVRAVQTARFPAAPEGVADDSASFALPMKFAD